MPPPEMFVIVICFPMSQTSQSPLTLVQLGRANNVPLVGFDVLEVFLAINAWQGD